jgi:hypothetical protein
VSRATTGVDQNDEDGGETVDAYLYSLEGGRAVFLEADDAARTVVIDLEETGRSRLKRLRNGEIEPGMFVVLRTQEHGDYVRPVADRLLGEKAEAAWTAERMWKEPLRKRVQLSGAPAVAAKLRRFGAKRADEVNTRYWASERNIGPRDREDFDAIMRFVGLESQGNSLWSQVLLLRSAHLRAGMQIMRRLLGLAKRADHQYLSTVGYEEFTLPGIEGVTLCAIRVLGRLPEVSHVPVSRLDQMFSAVE